MAEFPAPAGGIVLTHFIVASDVGRAMPSSPEVGRRAKAEHQQGDRDGDHAVGERDDPAWVAFCRAVHMGVPSGLREYRPRRVS